MQDLDSLLSNVEGWCTPNKAERLFALASAPECKIAVEIGIFGGKSLFPVAYAFKLKNEGVIYGVEPWDNEVAVETFTNDANDKWWKEIDLTAIKRGFLKTLCAHGLEKHARVLEIPSDAALQVFQSARYNGRIDLVHIDGSHSLEESVFDVAVWLRLLRPGGHIVLDDINWSTVELASKYLSGACETIYSVSADSLGHFAIFRKR